MTRAIGSMDGGDSLNSSNAGSSGTAGGSCSVTPVIIRPIGISPSIDPASGEDWFRGNKWPPENNEPPDHSAPSPWATNNVRHFTPVTFSGSPPKLVVTLPARAWDPAYYQLVLLTEFARAWVPTATMDAALQGILATALQPAQQVMEKKNLVSLIEYRDGDIDELIAQMDTFQDYFMGALGYTQKSHPVTYNLVQGALRAAEFAAMHYKNAFQRARPWQLWPELLPPVAVPGHASFPSAHSTQSHTVALVLQKAAAGVVASVVDVTTRMAQRISRGREVLGLHYPSDTAAGVVLAADVTKAYLSCPTVSRLLIAAEIEWAEYAT